MASTPKFKMITEHDMHREVFEQGLLRAKKSVKIATANVKNIHVDSRAGFRSILKTFNEMTLDGVSIDILHAGIPSGSFLHDMKASPLMESQRFQMRRCPRVHFKMILVDYQWIYIGSANFTGAGIGAKILRRRNFETGVITTDAAVIDCCYEQFDRIWHGVECGPCDRKEICPVPLESIKGMDAKPNKRKP